MHTDPKQSSPNGEVAPSAETSRAPSAQPTPQTSAEIVPPSSRAAAYSHAHDEIVAQLVTYQSQHPYLRENLAALILLRGFTSQHSIFVGGKRLREGDPAREIATHLYGTVEGNYVEVNRPHIQQQLQILKRLGFVNEKGGVSLVPPTRFQQEDPRRRIIERVIELFQTYVRQPEPTAITTQSLSSSAHTEYATQAGASDVSTNSREISRMATRLSRALGLAEDRIQRLRDAAEPLSDRLLDIVQLGLYCAGKTSNEPLTPQTSTLIELAKSEYAPIKERLSHLATRMDTSLAGAGLSGAPNLGDRASSSSKTRLYGQLQKTLPTRRELRDLQTEKDFLRDFFYRKEAEMLPNWSLPMNELIGQGEEMRRQVNRLLELQLLQGADLVEGVQDWQNSLKKLSACHDAFNRDYELLFHASPGQEMASARKMASALAQELTATAAELSDARVRIARELQKHSWYTAK